MMSAYASSLKSLYSLTRFSKKMSWMDGNSIMMSEVRWVNMTQFHRWHEQQGSTSIFLESLLDHKVQVGLFLRT